MDKKLELLCDYKNILGECPYYKDGIISWVDIVGKKLCILNNELKIVEFNEKISAAIPLSSEGYIVFGEKTIYFYKENSIKEYIKLDNIMKDGMRPNDAKVDKKGRIWFSTMMDDGISESEGALYCLNDNKIIFQENTKLGNGLAWNKKNDKFYYIDSILHKVYVYDYDLENGIISNKKVLFELKDGTPDGMTIDDNDNLFVAVWGGRRIEIRSSISGELLDTIHIPTELVTSCAFANNEYNDLIITTASLDKKDEYAGKVYKINLKYQGRKENFYKL